AVIKKEQISASAHKSALVVASSLGYLDVTQALLTYKNILEDNRGVLVLMALGNDQLEIALALLKSGPLSSEYQDLVLLRAKQKGYAEVIEALTPSAASS